MLSTRVPPHDLSARRMLCSIEICPAFSTPCEAGKGAGVDVSSLVS